MINSASASSDCHEAHGCLVTEHVNKGALDKKPPVQSIRKYL